MGNELVAEVKESETVWSGSRLLEDGFDLKEAFESNSWVAGGLATAATAADTAAAVLDPLGEALSAGIGWIIEHLSPLKDWLNELAGDSDAVAAAASTWTNIGAKLNSCAGDLEAVCSSRLAGQESLAVATFKSLQAGSASHLRMTGQLAGAISGGLTVASVIVRMVHDMVRDAIADIIGKLTSKAAITAVSLGTASGWAITSLSADVTAWATRLSKEVADVVTSAKNLKGLLSKANRLFDDVAEAFSRIPAKVSEAVTTRVEAAKDLASSLRNPQYALAGLPGFNMRQAGDMGRATPTVHRPSGGPTPPKTPRPNPNEGRWGVKLDDAASTTKSTSHATDAAADGAKSASHAADAAADGAKGAASAAGAAAASTKRAGSAADAAKTGKNADKYQKDIPELFRQHQAQKAAKQQAIERLDEAAPEGYSRSDFTRKRMSETIQRLDDVDGYSQREIENLKEMAEDVSKARKDLNDVAARIGEAGGEAHLTENGYHIPEEFRADNVTVNNGTAPRNWVDGMALSPNGDEMVVAEYKGVGARVDSTPRATTYEGKAPQASPAYTRDRMLSDPRFAQYFHDHPDVWQSVQNGDTKMTIKVIATREPGRIEVTNTPFELTPEVTQHLQNSIDKL